MIIYLFLGLLKVMSNVICFYKYNKMTFIYENATISSFLLGLCIIFLREHHFLFILKRSHSWAGARWRQVGSIDPTEKKIVFLVHKKNYTPIKKNTLLSHNFMILTPLNFSPDYASGHSPCKKNLNPSD